MQDRTQQSTRRWSRSAALLLAGSLLVTAGCGAGNQTVDEVRPESRWQTVDATAPPDAEDEQFLTADSLRKALGANENATFERAGRKFISAFLVNTGVKTLDPLSGQPLKRLDLSSNAISDISALKGMPLEQASFYDTKVSDLSPLEGMPLEVLDLTKAPVIDLSPLAGAMKLKTLFLEGAQVADLTPLKKVPLEALYLNQCPVTDLSPLTGKSFRELNLCETRIQDLNGLQGMTLGTLWIRSTAVSDLSPLKGSGLVSLDVQGSQVSDLSSLTEIPTLQRLNIADSKVTDLTPLSGLSLQRLIFTPSQITAGLDVIRNMTSLRELDTSFEGVETPLAPAEFWSRYDQGEFQKPASAVP